MNTNPFTNTDNIPKLDNDDKELCDIEINIEECAKALKKLPNNKSPGPDGLTTNFYKFFWPDIRELLQESYSYSFINNTLTQDQRMGILNLIPKKDKDPRYLANWRPVSLLTTDYKILTKALAQRLQKVIHKIINPDQVGYIKGRYIGENIRIIFDLLTHCEEEKIEAYIAQIDFEKAFDSIEWPFLFKTLEMFNFGDNFIKWIRILYTDIHACVGNNGHYSKYFKLTRSIRQGCPISALLFLLVAEIIAIDIRNDDNIKGIKIKDIIYKINLMADDTTLFLKDIVSLSLAIQRFDTFSKYSGLKLNLSKTELIPIGKSKKKKIILPEDLQKIKVKNGPFKALGIWFAGTDKETTELNLDNRMKNMETLINIWKPRNLSLKGKITIIKTLILPQIQFLFASIFIPDDYLKRIDALLSQYLWGKNKHGKNNKPKVKHTTLIAPIDKGGLGMVDVYAVHTASKCSWIKRLNNNSTSKCKNSTWNMLNFEPHLLYKNFKNYELKKHCKTKYHKQMIEEWFKINTKDPKTIEDILQQFIIYNQYITIDRKPILTTFFNIEDCNIQINDIIDLNGKIYKREELNTKLQTPLDKMKYNSLASSIPKKWNNLIKTKIKQVDRGKIVKNTAPIIQIGNIIKNIADVTSKQIYQKTIDKKIQEPTSINTWIDMFPFLMDLEWNKIFKLPFLTTCEPYLQSFQYKILNRILNCRDKLYVWDILKNNKCIYCDKIDTIEHHLFECEETTLFWNRLEKWMKDNLEVSISLTICEVLFGIPIPNNPDI